MIRNKEFFQEVHPDLIKIQQQVYLPQNWEWTAYHEEEQNKEYGACTFLLNAQSIRFRSAKLTPKKIGHFVTFWDRDQEGKSQPYQLANATDLLIISARNKQHFGHFIFPKTVLIEKGILSTNRQQGKRGIRVYPAWDQPTSKQAIQTQAWQLPYFIDSSASENTIQQQVATLYPSI